MWSGGCCNIDRVSNMLKVNVKRVRTPKCYRIRQSDSIFDNLDRELAHLSLRAGEIYDKISYLESKSTQNIHIETVRTCESEVVTTHEDPIQTLLYEVRKLSQEVQDVKNNQRKLNERLDRIQPPESPP